MSLRTIGEQLLISLLLGSEIRANLSIVQDKTCGTMDSIVLVEATFCSSSLTTGCPLTMESPT